MNKIIRDWPQINTYYTREYFWRTYNKFLEEWYVIQGIYTENTLLEINFWFEYDIQVNWIKQDVLVKQKEKQEREKYAFNCFNRKYEVKKSSDILENTLTSP